MKKIYYIAEYHIFAQEAGMLTTGSLVEWVYEWGTKYDQWDIMELDEAIEFVERRAEHLPHKDSKDVVELLECLKNMQVDCKTNITHVMITFKDLYLVKFYTPEDTAIQVTCLPRGYNRYYFLRDGKN